MTTDPVVSELTRFAEEVAAVIPSIDSATEGQYGAGIGSESEERQVELVLEALAARGEYTETSREVSYPDRTASCDILLGGEIPVEAKLLRYWRANGDPEPHWFKHVFSPFNKNTLLTDAERLAASEFEKPRGLLGLFYQRSRSDTISVEGLPDRFTASDLADKVTTDIEYWYDREVEVCEIASFEGLQHPVHNRGAAITWIIRSE